MVLWIISFIITILIGLFILLIVSKDIFLTYFIFPLIIPFLFILILAYFSKLIFNKFRSGMLVPIFLILLAFYLSQFKIDIVYNFISIKPIFVSVPLALLLSLTYFILISSITKRDNLKVAKQSFFNLVNFLSIPIILIVTVGISSIFFFVSQETEVIIFTTIFLILLFPTLSILLNKWNKVFLIGSKVFHFGLNLFWSFLFSYLLLFVISFEGAAWESPEKLIFESLFLAILLLISSCIVYRVVLILKKRKKFTRFVKFITQ